MPAPRGVVAAGHPLSAEAGAAALRAGGNAVDAALGAMLVSCVCEPLLTGLGAGGYMLVAHPELDPVLLDFFVEAPGRGTAPARPTELIPIEVSFGDAIQTFNVGAASVGTYGVAAGICEAARRFGRLELAELVAPAARLARSGVELSRGQAYVAEILAGIVTSTPEASALFAPRGALLRAGERLHQVELADTLERLGRDGAAPFYTGEIAAASADWLSGQGGLLTREDLAAYEVIERTPVRLRYRGREVLTNPPPSAGGILIAWALRELDRRPGTPGPQDIVDTMRRAQAARTPEFLDGLAEPGFAARFLRTGGRLGSTTHIAVLDGEGWACSVTCSNGSCSGVIVPGTGLHLNNMLGEQDLNPFGFHRYPPGRRLPSMMAPTVVLESGVPRLVLGSAGSNRIRSAILQTIVRVIDEGLPVRAAVEAPRVHFEDDVVYAEPGVSEAALARAGATVTRFREPNLFFGGVQAVERAPGGALRGAGDPRRGGAAVVVGET
jgi:gamma-glutamyltranspeptidase/glutathione hydrolase